MESGYEFCKVLIKNDGVMLLILPNGDNIPAQTFLSIEQNAGGQPFFDVTVKVLVGYSDIILQDADNPAKTEDPPLDS